MHGFSDVDLKEFSRANETPPGRLHPRSDTRMQMEMDQPRLVARLDQLKQAVYELRTRGGRID